MIPRIFIQLINVLTLQILQQVQWLELRIHFY